MGQRSSERMTAAIALQLGRVSNLPTVWSNVLVGTVLAGGQPWRPATLFVLLAVSLLYVGGMYLNDAFDRDVDALERPTRPIPAGLVAANTVFAAGFGMLLVGITLAMLAAGMAVPETMWRPVLASVALAAAIVFYDWNHKDNALSPFFMGLCRVLAYLTAGYAAASEPGPALFAAALVSLCYLIGLTYIAKQEAHDQDRQSMAPDLSRRAAGLRPDADLRTRQSPLPSSPRSCSRGSCGRCPFCGGAARVTCPVPWSA